MKKINMNNNNKRKSKVLMVFITIFVLSSLVISFLIGKYLIAVPLWEKKEKQIAENLVPLCNDKYYVYDDIDASTFEFDYYLSLCDDDVRKFCPEESSLSYFDFLAYTKSYYYFLLKRKLPKNEENTVICRTDLELNNFEEIISLKGKSEKMIHGCDKYFYFKIGQTYYVFDFSTLLVKECAEGSPESKIINAEKAEYELQYRYPKGSCKRNRHYCRFEYENETQTFDESLIQEEIYTLVLKYKFFPCYNLSYKNGLTSILYYANPDLLGQKDCLIIDYNRLTKSVVGYQAFRNVDPNIFKLYRQLEF